MTSGRRLRLVLLAALVGVAPCFVGARGQEGSAAPAATSALTAKIPLDPQIAVGRFSNGLRYYVRANKEPQNRAELRLVVNAGSVLEENDQRGLAHFVEHMAFNGTKHFPKSSDVVDFLQSIGMRFGRDVNAYTSYDETVYMLQVPTDKPEVLDKAMLILEDWAHNLSFDSTEIDKERGVITEEWRLGRGADARMRDAQDPILFKGSRYADRSPIGLMDVVQNFKHERLTKFYADWYRPDLMAVIAVGDFDRATVEGLVKTHFSTIPAAVRPKPRPVITVPPHSGTSYAIATDKEATSTRVAIYNMAPAPDQSTIGAYRRQIVNELYSGMLSARLSEIAQKPGSPFLRAGVGRGLLVRTSEAAVLSATTNEDGIDRSVQTLFTEATRVSRFGFTATEFAREKADIQRSLELAVAEKDKHDSASFAAEYARNFLEQEPIPGIVYESDLYKRFLPTITLAEIDALAKTWSPDRDRVVLVNAPEKVMVPSEAKLAADMSGVPGAELKPYEDTVDLQPLLERTPAAGSIVNTTTKEAYGITEWTLSNGATVVLKPTTFKDDEILLNAFSPGGDSLASDDDYLAASAAAEVVSQSGFGKFSAVDLRKLLAGKAATVRPSVGETEVGVSGSSSVKDLETFFQLVYLTFTAPRADRDIFNIITTRAKTQLANQEAQPEFAFNTALVEALTQNHLRSRPMTLARVDELNLDKSLAFYKSRFGDASGFTFVFVGSFDLQTMRPLVERYVASLPATHQHDMWKDVGMRNPTTVVEKRVEKGIDPKSEATIVFTGPFQYDQERRVAIRAMSMVLQNRLREVLREDLSGTYAQSVSASYSKVPIQRYQVAINFGSAPDRTDALVARTFQEIEQLKANGPSPEDVQSTKEILLRDAETSSRQNAFFSREISVRYEYGEDLKDLFGLTAFYNNLTAATIQDAARQYLDTNRYVKVTLFPEKK